MSIRYKNSALVPSVAVGAAVEVVGWSFSFLGSVPTNIYAMYGVDVEVARCCNIHVSRHSFGTDDKGCDSAPLGTHRAIVSLREGLSHYCAAEVGQRVLDEQFAMLSQFNPEFFIARNKKFLNKYMRGFPVSPGVYGGGYCYLFPFHASVRSRVARILGPNPYLADVLRMLRYGYALEYEKCRLEYVAEGFFHVRAQDGYGTAKDFSTFVSSIIDVLKKYPTAKVGGEQREAFGASRKGKEVHFDDQSQALAKSLEPRGGGGDDIDGSESSDASLEYEVVEGDVHAGVSLSGEGITVSASGGRVQGVKDKFAYAGNMYPPPVVDADARLKIADMPDVQERAEKLVEWLGERGYKPSQDALSFFLCSITASAFFFPGSDSLKARMRAFELIGDIVIKQTQAEYTLAGFHSLAEYDKLNKASSNKSLAALYTTCGLASFSVMHDVKPGSVAAAKMMEAVIGIFYSYAGREKSRYLLINLGLVPLGTYVPMVLKVDDCENLGYNSGQLAMALRKVTKF